MATDPTLARTIAEQEEILDAGIQSTAVDGVNTTFDLQTIEKRLSANKATRDGTRKRTLSGIRLDG